MLLGICSDHGICQRPIIARIQDAASKNVVSKDVLDAMQQRLRAEIARAEASEALALAVHLGQAYWRPVPGILRDCEVESLENSIPNATLGTRGVSSLRAATTTESHSEPAATVFTSVEAMLHRSNADHLDFTANAISMVYDERCKSRRLR